MDTSGGTEEAKDYSAERVLKNGLGLRMSPEQHTFDKGP